MKKFNFRPPGTIKRSLLNCRLMFIVIFFMSGCSLIGQYNPATGRNELVLISTDSEVQMGKEINKQILEKYNLYGNISETQRLERIGHKMAAVSDRQDYKYNFYLLDEKDLNAFTTPGGNIYMNSGLMEKLTADDQIASVLAHEIGHCAAKHTVKKYQASLGYGIIGSLILGRVSPVAQQIASMSSNVLMSLVFSAYSRKDEYQADKLAVKYLKAAGYNPNAFIDVLELLKKESKGSEGVLILRSHPYLDDRIKNVKNEISLDNI